jgi:uncharacterized protein (DUF4415 family)
MPKNLEPQPVPDGENPEWTAEKFARAKRLEQLPEGLQNVLRSRKRGPQKGATKTLISLRLSSDVLAALRASGKGWQTMVDEALRRQFVK